MNQVSWRPSIFHTHNISPQHQTPQQLPHQKHRQRPGKELHKNKPRSGNDASAKSPLPPKPLHRIRSSEGADDLSDRTTHRQRSLPGRRNNPLPVVEVAEVALESWGGVEVAEELGVEAGRGLVSRFAMGFDGGVDVLNLAIIT